MLAGEEICINHGVTVTSDSQSLHTCGRTPATNEHGYLLVSKSASTMVLAAKDEIVEVEQSAFVTDQATVASIDMFDGEYTVQVG